MEIIGKDLDKAMVTLGIDTEKTYQGTDESPFQVWELTDDAFEQLSMFGEDQWEDDFGWWRTGGCVYEGAASTEFTVNGERMMGYSGHPYLDDGDDEDLTPDTDFKNYESWFHESMGLGKETNMAIFALSLAKDNHMKLSDFMQKYQG